jgi:hypothetical protein
MRANPEDHTAEVAPVRRLYSLAVIVAVIVLVGFLVNRFWLDKVAPEEGVAAMPEPIALESAAYRDIPTAPNIQPKPAGSVSQQVSASIDVPPASPEVTGDEMLQQALSLLGFDEVLQPFVSEEHPLNVSAALLDGISRGVLLRKILPANPPALPFAVENEGGVNYMGVDSYKRYDVYVDSLVSLDVTLIAESFDRLRGVYESAYESLGLNPADFDNSVIRILDIVLATPLISDPIALERKSVMYLYADPDLEKMPSVQKQLLRAGPENIQRIQHVAQSLRDRLLEE